MPGKLHRFPATGRLLVGTDLQGNLGDFHALVDPFEARLAAGEDVQLLLTGDMIHGPEIPREDWPPHLGTFYEDRSSELFDAFVALRERHPGRVHALLGNHEHAHVGGPPTAKFWDDEAAHLEARAGPERSARMRSFFSSLPLVAVAPCGVVFTHGAPAARLDAPEDVESVEYGGHEDKYFEEILAVPILGMLLWARWAEPEAARAFAAALGASICLFGHDVVPEGFERIGDEQLIFSTSYGLDDAAKVYVELDLAARYRSVQELRVGHEILPLHRRPVP